MSTQFVTEVTVEVFDDIGLGADFETIKVPIKWEADFELREWGVKSVDVSVPEQRIELYYVDGATGEDVTKPFDLTNVIVDVSGVTFGQSLLPRSLEFSGGQITLVF